jgi:hypothetical protein
MFKDFPEFSKSLLNLMAAPANIEYTCIGFNDYYKLQENNDDLTSLNISEYLLSISKFMMTKTILRMNIEIKDEDLEEEKYQELIDISYHKHLFLVEGIPASIKTYFSKFTLKAVDSYLVTPTMSNDIVQKIIRNFENSMAKINNSKTGTNKTKHELLARVFVSHVLTKPLEKSEDEFFKFIEKLLRFWSGSSFYKQNEEYKIQINNNLSSEHLPQSHTCFFLIDLPDYTTLGISENEIGKKLYDKIDNAISNVAAGFSFAGGNRRCRRIRQSR